MPITREILKDQRQYILESLRSVSPDLVKELESIDLALQSLGEAPLVPGIFSPFKSAIDAVVVFLDKMKVPQDEETIAQGIVKGGWLFGNDRAIFNARSSIQFHLRQSESTRKLRRFPSGKVGRYGWPDSLDE